METFECPLLNEYFAHKKISKPNRLALSSYVNGIDPNYKEGNILHRIAESMPNDIDLFNFMVTNSNVDINSKKYGGSIIESLIPSYVKSINTELLEFILSYPKYIKNVSHLNNALENIYFAISMVGPIPKKLNDAYNTKTKAIDILLSHGAVITSSLFHNNLIFMKGNDIIKYTNIYLSYPTSGINDNTNIILERLLSFNCHQVDNITSYLNSVKTVINAHPNANMNIFYKDNLSIFIQLCDYPDFITFMVEKGFDIKKLMYDKLSMKLLIENDMLKNKCFKSLNRDYLINIELFNKFVTTVQNLST